MRACRAARSPREAVSHGGLGSSRPPRAQPGTGDGARTPRGRAASSLTLVVISELVSTAASDMVGHAGDPLQRGRDESSSRTLARELPESAAEEEEAGGRAAKAAAASAEQHREQCKDGFSEQPVGDSRGARSFNID